MRPKVDTELQLAALASAQHGVVARWQLLRLGLSDEAVTRRTAAGRLHRLHRGVYAVGHTALKVEGRWMAAVLALGSEAVLSHATAAAAWELRRSSGVIHVTVPSTAGRSRRRDIRLHRSRTLTPAETTTVRAIPITTPVRTIVDLATTLEGRPLEHALDLADQRRLIDFAALRNRPIPASLQAVLSLYTAGSTVTRSELEERFIALCDRRGIRRPKVNTSIEGQEVDFAWRAERLVVEVDGYSYHRAPSRFESDRERDVILALAGWRVLRFTWAQLTRRSGWVATAISAALSVDPARADPRGSGAWRDSATGSLDGTSSTASPSAPPGSRPRRPRLT